MDILDFHLLENVYPKRVDETSPSSMSFSTPFPMETWVVQGSALFICCLTLLQRLASPWIMSLLARVEVVTICQLFSSLCIASLSPVLRGQMEMTIAMGSEHKGWILFSLGESCGKSPLRSVRPGKLILSMNKMTWQTCLSSAFISFCHSTDTFYSSIFVYQLKQSAYITSTTSMSPCLSGVILSAPVQSGSMSMCDVQTATESWLVAGQIWLYLVT